MSATGGTARVLEAPTDDGARLAVEVHEPHGGAGRGTVLLAHGFPHARWLWAGVLPAVAAAGWRAAAPDLRGFGGSSLGGPAFRASPSVERYADDLAAVLDALGERAAVVGGLSMGGYVALAFWRRHRDRTRALILADTRAEPDAAEARARRDAHIALVREQGPGALADAQLDGSLGRSSRAARGPALRALLAAAPVEASAATLAAMRDRPDAGPELAGVRVPVLVVGGEEDAVTPAKRMRALAAAVPDGRFVGLAGAGHLSAWERPEPFAEALVAFLDNALPPTNV